ncbi:MAG: glycoside hydrolase family 5 protein [Clostridiales bacterium]|nr:glycoside hydrolase family 5 protein [Clostridiales bacterium]
MFNCYKMVTKITAAALLAAFMASCPVMAEESMESADEAVSSIGAGWNLGNTLDSYGTWINASAGEYAAYETAWNNPLTTKAMIDSVRDQGFNAIRIPVTWSQHIDGSGHVDAGWMNRVKEVVDYAYDDGMYVILNVHHDTGEGGGDKVSWIFADGSTYQQTGDRYAGLWTEIAEKFKDYGERLLFEGYNEIMDRNNTWNAPSDPSSYPAVDSYAQLFVDTVRATGGNNSSRNLIVNTYVSSVDQNVLNNFSVPSDPSEGHLICEVHCYHPWGFTGTSQSVNWTPVHNDFTDADRSEIDGIMNSLKSFSDSKGLPVIIGEYGAEFKNNEDQIVSYAGYFVDAAGSRGIKCFYWDNGDYKTSGEGGYAIFDRSSLTWKTAIAGAIVSAAAPYTDESGDTDQVPSPAETEETTAVSSETSVTETVETGTSAEVTNPPEDVPEDGETAVSLVPFIVIDVILVAGAAVSVVVYLRKKSAIDRNSK